MSTASPVYVVDDDGSVLDSTRFLLDSLGIRCLSFIDPLAFVSECEGLAPGCVLTDFNMPGMSGIELRAALRDKRIFWPVILMSAHSSRKSIGDLPGLGITDFIDKPFTLARLSQALELAFAQLSGRLAPGEDAIGLSRKAVPPE
jgi:FixJ family two-component response regulator